MGSEQSGRRTGTQSGAIVEAMHIGSRRFDRVAAGQDGGLLVKKLSHLFAITTTGVFRHGQSWMIWMGLR